MPVIKFFTNMKSVYRSSALTVKSVASIHVLNGGDTTNVHQNVVDE